MYACNTCHHFTCDCGAVARLEASAKIWRCYRGSSSVPVGPDHTSKADAFAWGAANLVGFYTVSGF